MHANPSYGDLNEARSTGAVVLGAGFGSRFGDEDKLGATLAGKAVAHHALSTLQPFHWARKVLVYRSSREWIDAFRNHGYWLIRNEDPGQGMLSSLRRGVLAAQDLRNVLVCLADMPFVGTDHIAKLLSTAERMDGQVIASRAKEYRGPPAIFPVAELMRLPPTGQDGAKSLLANAAFVDYVSEKLMDIDTQQDLETARRR